ncbi:MAG: YdcF family protein [Clostridia bacterium]|nr:YdcF family protein [Clostridia bacterium]
MKRKIMALLVALTVLLSATALGEEYQMNPDNEMNFGTLIINLLHAYEKPSDGDGQRIDAALETIRQVSAADYDLAFAIADQWRRVYLDAGFVLHIHRGEPQAAQLQQTALADSPAHAFVVLGYELKNGEMTDELKGRCDAAAAAARAFPSAIVVCSGGPTGKNNPMQHTEAGMMRDYLVTLGVDESRIYIDERAMSTVQNAINTFEILQAQGVESYTLVTSTYHQRWAQVVYRTMAEIYRQNRGYTAGIVENYSFDIEPSERYRRDDIMAARQLCAILKLSDETVEAMKQLY